VQSVISEFQYPPRRNEAVSCLQLTMRLQNAPMQVWQPLRSLTLWCLLLPYGCHRASCTRPG